MKRFLTTDDEDTNLYASRCENRENKLMKATMDFVNYFVSLGDDIDVAKNKVSQLSTETNADIYGYVLGNKTPLFDKINASTLPFMDGQAKNELITYLS